MIRCNHCGTNNLDGSEYCDECGTRLAPAEELSPRQPYAPPAQFITQVAPPPPPSFTKDNVPPKPATPYASPAQPATPYASPAQPATPYASPAQPATPYAPSPPPSPSSGQPTSSDPAVGTPGRGADQIREGVPKRSADPALKPITTP